ncbi:MAG TPA: MBL fold metallo-hydrolase [Candidatus Saccharimonadales bacterium]|nr:MBL fold metallo-hydrolase [Candidatus Saccharimonadales bacterium]
MFDIEYKGANAVVITTKKSTAVIDPNLSLAGGKNVPVKDAVEIATEDRFAVSGQSEQLLIEGPGEYEVGDFSIRGIAAQRHIDTPQDEKVSTMYRIEVGEVRIAVLGNIAPKLTEDQQEAIGVIDILILPVGGGGYTLDATSAATIVRQLDPKVVIPTHYADDALKYEVPQDSVEVFTKELGVSVESLAKVKVKSAASLPEALTVFQVAKS